MDGWSMVYGLDIINCRRHSDWAINFRKLNKVRLTGCTRTALLQS